MWLTLSVSFGVALLSGLGVGSAGLFVVYLTAVAQFSQLAAQGLNLVFFLFSSGAALLVHLTRTKLPFGCILFILLGGIPGTLLGTFVAHRLPTQLLRMLFGAMLIVSGILGLFKRKKS